MINKYLHTSSTLKLRKHQHEIIIMNASKITSDTCKLPLQPTDNSEYATAYLPDSESVLLNQSNPSYNPFPWVAQVA
jgi:hypothetical protein